MKLFRMLALGTLLAGSAASQADTVLLNETFDGYADDTALFTQWTNGSGSNVRLSDNSLNAVAFPLPGQKGAEHIGGTVSSWLGLAAANKIVPSSTQSIVLQGDIYHDGVGNKRMSIGLRGGSSNISELGNYNTGGSCNPTICGVGTINGGVGTQAPENAIATDPGYYLASGYAARTVNYGTVIAPTLVQPGWQYFSLPIELDREIPAGTPPNGIVNITDIGAGWHQYKLTITPTSVKYEIDLFRDGLKNTSRTPDPGTGIRPGTAGVDGMMQFAINVNLTAGYDSLRLGGPSGIASAGGGLIYDNVKLSLIDLIVTPPNTPDFNRNNLVDAADYSIWRDNAGLATGATQDLGDANGDGAVNAADYTAWSTRFGEVIPPAVVAGQAVPEPAAIAVLLIGLVAGCRLRKSH